MHFQDRVDGGRITIENGAPRGHLTLHGLSEHQAAKQHDLRVINQQGVLVYSSLQAGEQKERACPLHVIVIPLKNLLSTAKKSSTDQRLLLLPQDAVCRKGYSPWSVGNMNEFSEAPTS
jgi:hypothetical protein